MRVPLWPCLALLLGCESWYSDNPSNCVQNSHACSSDEFCNQVTLRCETLDCTVNSALCTGSDVCDTATRRCQPLTFVLGQPDEKSNENVAYGMDSPQSAILIPGGAGQQRVVVGDVYNHRVLIWNDVPATGTRPLPDAVLGMPNLGTLSGTGAYGGVTERSLDTPWSLTSDGTTLIVGDQSHNRLLMWKPLPTSNAAGNGEPLLATGLWGQSSYERSTRNAGGFVSNLGVDSPLVFVEPAGIGTGKFFISDGANHRVLIFEGGIPASSGTLPTKVIGQTSFLNGTGATSRTRLRTPRGLSTVLNPGASGSGPLFVADSDNNRVVGFGPGQWQAPGSATSANYLIGQADFVSAADNRGGGPGGNTLSSPQAVGFCGSMMFVADQGNHRVLGYNDTQNTPAIFIPPNAGANPMPTPNVVADLVLGQPGYNANQPNRGGMPGPDTLNSPSDVRCDGTRLIVADSGNHRVLIWNNPQTLSNGAPANVILGQPANNTAVANNPRPLGKLRYNHPGDVASDGQSLVVADTGNHRVLIWRMLPRSGDTPPDVVLGQATLDDNLANGGVMASATSLASPIGVTLESGRLAVADRDNNRVLIWNRLPASHQAPADFVVGQPDFTSTTAGDAPGQILRQPYGVRLADSVLYVTDAGNNRALVYRTLGQNNPTAALTLGNPSAMIRAADALSAPRGVTTGGGKLLIADTGNHRVLVWNTLPTRSGQPADLVVGQGGFMDLSSKTTNPRVNSPHGVTLTGDRLFVSAAAQNRILFWNQVPTESGHVASGVLGQIDFFSDLPNATDTPPLEHLSSPAGMAIVGNQLFIADTFNNRVVVRAVPRP